jgi:hypothetical protein
MPPRLVKKSQVLPLRDDGTLTIAAVADNH